jgi:predicted Zn-dependent protease
MLDTCEAPEGLAALGKMQNRLARDLDLPYPLTVTVLDHDLVNAFALPGGHVVFFRGLIDAAETPEEVAAVFAHELGHVASRDPTRIALRSAGSIGVLGLLLGDFAGGAVVLMLAEQLIEADYTQEAEVGADEFAHDMLSRNGVSPEALGTMFRRFRDLYGEAEGITAHLSSHPALGDRIAAAESAAEQMMGPDWPVLRATEWADLRAICGG